MAYFTPEGVKVNGEFMNNFLISIEKGEDGFYYAFFSDGTTVDLGTNDYAVAVCAADQLEIV
jgi:hypothetical protein